VLVTGAPRVESRLFGGLVYAILAVRAVLRSGAAALGLSEVWESSTSIMRDVMSMGGCTSRPI